MVSTRSQTAPRRSARGRARVDFPVPGRPASTISRGRILRRGVRLFATISRAASETYLTRGDGARFAPAGYARGRSIEGGLVRTADRALLRVVPRLPFPAGGTSRTADGFLNRSVGSAVAHGPTTPRTATPPPRGPCSRIVTRRASPGCADRAGGAPRASALPHRLSELRAHLPPRAPGSRAPIARRARRAAPGRLERRRDLLLAHGSVRAVPRGPPRLTRRSARAAGST